MAVNPELRLISQVVKQGSFRDLLRGNIRENMFSNPEARAMFIAIWEYYHSVRHPGKVPRRAWMEKKFPNFVFYKSGESVAELCEEVRQLKITREIEQLVAEVQNLNEIDPYKALNKLRSRMISIGHLSSTSRDILLSEAGDFLIREYELLKNNEGILGIPFPWDPLNQETQGMHPEQFIIVYGRLKSMKSFIGILMAIYAYMEANKRVLFYSAELPKELVIKRAATAVCSLDYRKVSKRGNLSPEEEKYYFETVKNGIKMSEEMFSDGKYSRSFKVASDLDERGEVAGVSHIRAKIEEFQPDIVFVDSYYRMKDDRSGRIDLDWKVQGSIARDLKTLAQQAKIPVVGITQANRASKNKESQEGMEDASYTDVQGQETDLGLRLIKEGKDEFGTNLKVIMAASRETEASGFALKFAPYTRCDFIRWLTDEDMGPREDDRPKRGKKVENEEKLSKREAAAAEKFLKQQQEADGNN